MINSISGFNNFNKEILTVGSSKANVFSEMLNNSINSLDSYQKRADNSVISFIKGDESEVHNVMIAMQEARLTLQTAIEIRNKMVEAYQELSKIQI